MSNTVYNPSQNYLIQSTTDYSQFRLDPTNRTINQDHLEKLYDAIKNKNLLKEFPILVTEDGTVLAPGRRFLRPYSAHDLLVDFITYQFRLIRADAYRAVGGVDAARRVTAGEALAALGSASPDKPRDLVIRIGLNTGPVSLGQVGSDDGQTAIGDAVNVASRLKEAALEGGIEDRGGLLCRDAPAKDIGAEDDGWCCGHLELLCWR